MPKPRGEFNEKPHTDRKREVTSRCKECRSEDYFSKRYPTVCFQCNKHRPLDTNSICRKCNEDNGVRQCHGTCNDILPALMEFEGKRTTCKLCRANAKLQT